MPSRLDHFIAAQDPVFDQVIRELTAGQKQSHWMWFIFPQLRGLGQSPISQLFAIDSLDHARQYHNHPILGPRLDQCTRLVNNVPNRTAHEIFGRPDDLKFCSSMTLFSLCTPPDSIFSAALAKYYNSTPDPKTLRLLKTT
jgi:uncharacterized protein (DUF1810 family)